MKFLDAGTRTVDTVKILILTVQLSGLVRPSRNFDVSHNHVPAMFDITDMLI